MRRGRPATGEFARGDPRNQPRVPSVRQSIDTLLPANRADVAAALSRIRASTDVCNASGMRGSAPSPDSWGGGTRSGGRTRILIRDLLRSEGVGGLGRI